MHNYKFTSGDLHYVQHRLNLGRSMCWMSLVKFDLFCYLIFIPYSANKSIEIKYKLEKFNLGGKNVYES